MYQFTVRDARTVTIRVDLDVYNEAVISKVLYGLSDSYDIARNNENGDACIRFTKKDGEFTAEESRQLKSRLSRDFVDFKTRDIVNRETKAIRELLLVKAFANSDEFDEGDLLSL